MEILAYTRQHTSFSRALAKHSFTREVENRSIRSAAVGHEVALLRVAGGEKLRGPSPNGVRVLLRL
jgi:hypothetical protein